MKKKTPSEPGQRVRYTEGYIRRKGITANIPREGIVTRVNAQPRPDGEQLQADVNWCEHGEENSRTVDVEDLEVIKS